MSFEIVDSSPKAQTMAENGQTGIGRSKYPFEALSVGKSFLVEYEAKRLASLKTLVARRNKSEESAARFVVVHHEDIGKIEVSRSV